LGRKNGELAGRQKEEEEEEAEPTGAVAVSCL